MLLVVGFKLLSYKKREALSERKESTTTSAMILLLVFLFFYFSLCVEASFFRRLKCDGMMLVGFVVW